MSTARIHNELINLLNEDTITIDLSNPSTFSALLKHIDNARIILMGEASHGTEEFYQARIALSKILIKEKGFHAIAIEGDWPSAYQTHCYLQDKGNRQTVEESLSAFKRFPAWMWRNTAMVAFLRWLKSHNNTISDNSKKVGFYGLDLYSLHDSMQAIINYLKKYDPENLTKAMARYNCFDHIAVDPQMYGYLVNQRVKKDCIKEVVEQFLEIQHMAFTQLNNHLPDNDYLYYTMQNARVVKNAEEYYRTMFEPRAISWNIRDNHMAETLSNLIAHIETTLNTPAKIIVWAHNSHVGDARATEMYDRGEINIGQIVKERYDIAAYSLGFSTYTGTVRAASDWDGEPELKKVLPALKGSYEFLFHDVSEKNFFLNLRGESHLLHLLKQSQLQRAIGVIYLPETERYSHYYFASLPYQFDGIIHFDESHAVKPLDLTNVDDEEEFSETYPKGI